MSEPNQWPPFGNTPNGGSANGQQPTQQQPWQVPPQMPQQQLPPQVPPQVPPQYPMWQAPQQYPSQYPQQPMQYGRPSLLETARRAYSRLGAAFSVMLVVWNVVMVIFSVAIGGVNPEALNWAWVSLLLSDLALYVIAIPIAYAMMRPLPELPTREFRLTPSRLFVWFLISMAIMFIGSLLSNGLIELISEGNSSENRIDTLIDNIPPWLNLLSVAVVGPIIEEWLCRKQIISRMRRYGEKTAILVSALIFGLMHMNLYQFFYAFGLGLVFGYIYVRTSRLRYTIGLHMALNFLGSVASPFFSDWLSTQHTATTTAEKQMETLLDLSAELYMLLYLIAVVAGMILLIVECRKLEFYETPEQLPKGTAERCAFGNAGMIVFLVISIALTVLALIQ